MNGVRVEWMIRAHMRDVLSIEREAFPSAWREEEFLDCLRQRNCIGIVAECEQELVGYAVYELGKRLIRILNFAVRCGARRSGVGRTMFERIASKVGIGRERQRVVLEVRESNLSAQLFFRAMGCRYVVTKREFYEDTDEDAYELEYKPDPPPAVAEAATDECGR